MTEAEALAKLQTLFDKLFLTPPTLTPALTAKEVPEWDSLMQINLVVAVEKAFEVRFRVGEVEKAKDIGSFIALILARKKPA